MYYYLEEMKTVVIHMFSIIRIDEEKVYEPQIHD